MPGVCVGSGATRPVVHTTHVVMMQHEDVSVVTIMADYEGPLEPFALVLPVPQDVSVSRLRSVKHEFISRVEEVSAPRFHEFWEKDPCVPGEPEQAWEEKIPVKGRGFLTPQMLPPPDDSYAVSNEISVPEKPIFKGAEGEFRYTLLRPKGSSALRAWLEGKGYHPGAEQIAALEPWLGGHGQLLVAEVTVGHAELIDSQRLQLGGIRYWTQAPLEALPVRLGLTNLEGHQDLFIYMLHRQLGFRAKNYGNVMAATNVAIRSELASRLGVLYNALFDLSAQKHPLSFVTEFAGSTAGCGEPCPNAPLELRELMTLGGDVLEARTTSAAERAPEPAAESDAELQKLETKWQALSPGDAAEARRQHRELQRELWRRRALEKRQTYVLTRLHYRYAKGQLPEDVQLAPVRGHFEGGYGIPRGPGATLSGVTKPAPTTAFQVRFFAAHPWQGSLECRKPERWRWGKRWSSHSQQWRKVRAARDLPRLGRDPALLRAALTAPLPALGLEAAPRPEPARSTPRQAPHAKVGGCSASPGFSARPGPSWVLLPLLFSWVRGERRPRRDRIGRGSPRGRRLQLHETTPRDSFLVEPILEAPARLGTAHRSNSSPRSTSTFARVSGRLRPLVVVGAVVILAAGTLSGLPSVTPMPSARAAAAEQSQVRRKPNTDQQPTQG